MSRYVVSVFTVFCVAFGYVGAECDVLASTESGRICGVKRWAETGTIYDQTKTVYASFRGIPYAKQPLGELRFKELQPAETWDDVFDASVEGPICPQHDILYGRLMKPRNVSEACINANIHVPLYAMPGFKNWRQRPLPIFVFVHGGGFAFGSGDTDLHGPEFMVQRDMIVVTFNYRINVFGYLSLNSSSIPGNNGLRDIITFLRWVKNNAKYFGGDPENITLGGQSAGAANVHLLTLSKAAEGLFKRAILMSGTALPTFYSGSPIYAQFVANSFLTVLGINATDPEEIHDQLVSMPIEQIMQANQIVQDHIGITAFMPVVETAFPGVTTVLDEDPVVLVANGVGKDIPLLVGFTSSESETFRPNFERLDMLARVKGNPLALLPIDLIYKLPLKTALESADRIEKRYLNGQPTMDKYVQLTSDVYFKYPALQLAKLRMSMIDAAPMYLYQFSYEAEFNVIAKSKGIKYSGAGHIEDLTFIFKTNSMQDVKGYLPRSSVDTTMTIWMTMLVQNFINCDKPTCTPLHISAWPPVSSSPTIYYQNIKGPYIKYQKISEELSEVVEFFEGLYNQTRT
ncbi:unnamed protein product [Leptosia nina]|uniref:Carboxylic ester hydrolase n=1 Tax=Leptosia nina TaxID=320188 RepID=A0AAV1JDY3_9NEOP